MNKMKMLLTLVIAGFILNQCSTTTSVKVLKPAELDVGAVKKVAVLDFEFQGSWDFSGTESKPQDLKGLGQKILRDALTKETSPDPLRAYPGASISDRLVAKLVNNKYYTVIERKEMAKILEEQALGLSGVIDETTAAEVGKLLGAQGLIMGSGTYHVQDEGEWETYKEKNEEKKRYRIRRYVDANINFKIVNVTSGTIVASKTNTAANYSGGKRSISQNYTATGVNEQEARKVVPDWRPIVDGLVNRILDQIVAQIAPHYVFEKRKIEEGDSPAMDTATEYAKRGLWDDARGIWESVSTNNSADMEDRVAATYNLGLYYEIHGQLDEAEELFDKSFKMSGETKYLDAKARIQNRRRELELLKRQQGE